MLYFFLVGSQFFNFCFFIFAIGFVIAFILEQVVKQQDNEMNTFIVVTNRKFLWRQTWIVNFFWFFCNICLNFASRSAQVPGSDIIWRGDL